MNPSSAHDPSPGAWAIAVGAVRARTAAQREASRRNGAKSKGPVGTEGKFRASKNALEHGLWAAVHLVVPGEDPAALAALRAAFAAEYAPEGILAACLADRLALAFWKLARGGSRVPRTRGDRCRLRPELGRS